MSTDIYTPISREVLDEALSYEAYRALVDDLLAEGRTTNDDNGQNMLDYTKMAVQRMSRWDKRGVLDEELVPELSAFPKKLYWVVLTEGWCGDASQIMPVLNIMAQANDKITLKVLLRDQHLEIMDQFLTNGVSRSIPKLVVLDAETLEVLGDWGPRPKIAQDRFLEMKNNPEVGAKKASEELHKWYAKDKGKTMQIEILELLRGLVK